MEETKASVGETSVEQRSSPALVEIESRWPVIAPEVLSSVWLDERRPAENRLAVWWKLGCHVCAVVGVAFLAICRRVWSVPARRVWTLFVHCKRVGQCLITDNVHHMMSKVAYSTATR